MKKKLTVLLFTLMFLLICCLHPQHTKSVKAGKLDAPDWVSASYYSQSSIRISWASVENANSYSIYFSDEKDGEYSKLATTGNTTYYDKQCSGTYYKVKARNGTKSNPVKVLYKDYADNEEFNQHYIELKSLDNLRDLGGYETKDGTTICQNKLFRSANLHSMTKSDRKELAKYGITRIYDLRRVHTVIKKPDKSISGATILNYSTAFTKFSASSANVNTSGYQKTCDLSQIKGFRAYRTSYYNHLLLDSDSIKQYRKIFDSILANEGKPVLWHCAQGKDRTGVMTVIMMYALNCNEKDILNDFDQSNTAYLDKLTKSHEYALKNNLNQTAQNAVFYQYGVDTNKLKSDLNDVKEQYGSMKNYLNKAIGLSDKDLQTLRSWYTE